MTTHPDLPILRARGIHWQAAGQSIVTPLDLELLAGESLLVVGPNGAGKTTLLRLLAGILTPSGGSLELRGEPFSRFTRRDLARHMAYLPQQGPGEVPLDVKTFVELARYPWRRPWQIGATPRDRSTVASALARTGVSHLTGRPVNTLSGGEAQLVALAAALAQEAPIWILDEPTAHLDPAHKRTVARLLRELHASHRLALVVSTHDLDLAAYLADRVLALSQGTAVARGTAGEILSPGTLKEIFSAPFQHITTPSGKPHVWLELP